MDKPILFPDEFFTKITSLVKNFEMSGKANLETSWRRTSNPHLCYTMSWDVRYAYGVGDNSCRTNTFMPHTFAGLLDRSERLSSRHPVDPLTELRQYAAPWIEEDNALLALCVQMDGESKLSIMPLGGGQGYHVKQPYRSKVQTFQKETWREVVEECVFNALHHRILHFYQFEACSPFHQQRILDVLRERPVHNEETAQMYKVDLHNEVEGMATKSRARKL